MPFVIVQLANYDGRQQTGFPRPVVYQEEPVNSGWAQLREAQRTVAKADPYAELAVINDLGETVDIHPLRKKEVAERVGLCFDRLVFHDKKASLSPEVVSAEVKDDQIILTLDQPVQSGELYEFEIAGSDGKFVNAEATANGNTIVVKAAANFSLFTPHSSLKLRYAWKDNPLKANVCSLGGLPMSSFEMNLKE